MEEIEKLSSMISNLLQRVENLDKKTNKIEKHCLENHALLEKKISDLTKSSEANINELMLEMEQRSQRSGNLIFFGLPEQNDGSVEERLSLIHIPSPRDLSTSRMPSSA